MNFKGCEVRLLQYYNFGVYYLAIGTTAGVSIAFSNKAVCRRKFWGRRFVLQIEGKSVKFNALVV